MLSVLKRPIISEKATQLSEHQCYTFEVGVSSNKIEIRKAVEKQFGVNVVDVRTVNSKRQPKEQFTRKGKMSGAFAATKKAYVTLKEGQTIDIFDVGSAE